LSKRHTSQNSKQALGQYFTSNADRILSGFEKYVMGKTVIDPFAGAWDLLYWAKNHGANKVKAYDIDPKVENTVFNDSLLNPPEYSNALVVTNPPYLSANKSKGKYKDIYAKWQQSDLYKCFLASLSKRGANEAIVIIPSNFFCESNIKARTELFSEYDILFAKYWRERVFDDATTGVCAFYLKRRKVLNPRVQNFNCLLLPENIEVDMHLEGDYGYIHGGAELASLNKQYKFEKATTNHDVVNTKIVVGCIDGGKYDLGFHINEGTPIKTAKTVITTFQVNTVGFELSDIQQRNVVTLANQRLYDMRKAYYSMFLSNYMGATQKIMSVSIAKSFLSDAVKNVVDK
jgi:hypothetical protein